MAFTRTIWQDSPSTSTPITAAQLQRMEDGIRAGLPFFDVRDYGAALDDTTNDAARLQAALDAAAGAGGGTVLVPGRCYLGSTTVTQPGNTLIRGVGRDGSWLRKATGSTGIMLDCSGTGTGFANHKHSSGLQDITLKGGGPSSSGALLRLYYNDNYQCRGVKWIDHPDRGIDAVELWDSYFLHCTWESVGGYGATPQRPSVHIRSASAASGFGSGTDNSNMIWFSQCRFEGFADGALWVEAGSNANNPNGIYLDQIKFETHTTRGKVLWFDDYCMSVAGSRLEFYVGAYDAGYSTPVSVVLCAASQAVSFRDIRFVTGEAPTTDKLMELWCSAGPLTVDGVQHTSTGTPANNPATGVVWLGGTGRSRITNITSADGATLVAGTNPHIRTMTYAATLAPVVTSSDLTLRVTLTGNTTVSAPTQGQAGDRLTFAFTQDATGGRTVSWNAAFKTSWTPTTTANKVNVITFTYDGTSWVQTSTATNL